MGRSTVESEAPVDAAPDEVTDPREEAEEPKPAGEPPEAAPDGGEPPEPSGEDAPEAAPRKAKVADADEDAEGGADLGPGEARSDDELLAEATALLFASPDPLGPGRLRNLLERPAMARVKAVLARLAEELEASPLPLVARQIAGGWRILTDPAMGDVVLRLRKEAKPERITAAGLETLAIVAYRQPVTNAEVEAIRGVQSGAMLRSLVDRGLLRVTGRASLPGSPLQYGTTKEFLERFGLASLKDLPRDGELTES